MPGEESKKDYSVVNGENVNETKTETKNNFMSLPMVWRACILILIVFCVILLIAVIVIATSSKSKPKQTVSACRSDTVEEFKPNPDVSIFHDLSEEELQSVHGYLTRQPSLNITPFEKATLKDNYIYAIELFLPKKSDALKFLDEGGKKPERLARVILMHGAIKTPVVAEYLVGPLPKPTFHKNLLMNNRKTKIPFYGRPFTVKELEGTFGIIKNATKFAYPLLKESFNYWLHNCTDRCLHWLPIAQPARREKGKRHVWVQFSRNIKPTYLFNVPLQFLVDCTGAENQKIVKVVYNNQQFNSIDELMSKYEAGSLKMLYLKDPSKEVKLRATLQQRGDPMPAVPKRGPVIADPDGRRFTVHGNKLTYMNWRLDFGIRPTAGMGLFDVKFKGKRIAYEISLQEGMAFYSGYDPETSNAHYLDSVWGLGSSNTPLMMGIDCPENAIYLDSFHFLQTDKPVKNSRSICIFETNTGIPLWRHFDVKLKKDTTGIEGFWFQGGLVDHALVIRVVSTPFNYDYIFDYILHQNGVIQVRTTASGYINPSVYTPDEAKFGFLSFDQMIGSIHDHFMLYKVDLDVAGRKNSYETVDAVPKNVSYEWEDNTYRIKKFVVKNKKKNEKEALLRYDFNKPKYLVFMNENKTNLYGNPRGYRIDIRNKVKQLYSDDYYMNDVAAWSKYQLMVSKHHDSERFGSSIYNQFMMNDPAFNFDSIINDNESIENEDLVAWVNVGGLHIPNTEDLPVTNTLGSSYEFLIKPFGYFDEDPSLGSTTAVLLDTDKDGKSKVSTYGTPEESSCPLPKRKLFG